MAGGTRWWARARRWIPSASRCWAWITSAAAAPRTGPAAGGSFPCISSYDQAEAVRAAAGSPADPEARGHCRRFLRRHGGAGLRRAASVAGGTADRHQRAPTARIPWPRPGAASSATWRAWAWPPAVPPQALELARALAMTTYRSPEEFAARFRKPPRMENGPAGVCGGGIPAGARPRLRGALPARNPSSACPNPSTCTRWMPRALRCAPKWWPCARTSSCPSPTCAR